MRLRARPTASSPPRQAAAYDVLTVGRTGVDIYPLQVGVGLEDVHTFGKFLGGTAANVAVAAARHGLRTALVTRTGDDPFGRFVHQALRELGVDDRFVTAGRRPADAGHLLRDLPAGRLPAVLLPPPGRAGHAADRGGLRPGRGPGRRVFWTTGSGAVRGAEPVRAPRRLGRPRPAPASPSSTWTTGRCSGRTREAAREQLAPALEQVTVAVGNLDECDTAVGERDPHRAAAALLERGLELAVVKQGPKGVLARTRDELVEVPPIPVEVVNGLGAGDAFGGALCHGLLAGWPLERVIRFANAAGAIVASRLECSDADADRPPRCERRR